MFTSKKKTCTEPLVIRIKNWCLFCKVESVALNNADGTTAVLSSSDKLLKYNRGENLNLNMNASVCTKTNIYSVCTYSSNLQITSRLKNGYLVLIMSADEPPVGSCEVYSNVAFRDGIVWLLLQHQTEGHGQAYSVDSGVFCRIIQQTRWFNCCKKKNESFIEI